MRRFNLSKFDDFCGFKPSTNKLPSAELPIPAVPIDSVLDFDRDVLKSGIYIFVPSMKSFKDFSSVVLLS